MQILNYQTIYKVWKHSLEEPWSVLVTKQRAKRMDTPFCRRTSPSFLSPRAYLLHLIIKRIFEVGTEEGQALILLCNM